jgi:hypothetical protein
MGFLARPNAAANWFGNPTTSRTAFPGRREFLIGLGRPTYESGNETQQISSKIVANPMDAAREKPDN